MIQSVTIIVRIWNQLLGIQTNKVNIVSLSVKPEKYGSKSSVITMQHKFNCSIQYYTRIIDMGSLHATNKVRFKNAYVYNQTLNHIQFG